MDKDNVSVKDKFATAITYDKNDAVPKVVAKGKGNIAERIIEEAKKNDITVYEDKELASLLQNIEVDENIPSELYDVVAQVLVFVSDIDKKVKDKILGESNE